MLLSIFAMFWLLDLNRKEYENYKRYELEILPYQYDIQTTDEHLKRSRR